MNFEEEFIKVLGKPYDEIALKEYIMFVKNRPVYEDMYNEKHHILPRSVFGDNEYVFEMSYSDHIEAHYMLSKAYPIREFTRPLNFMLPKDEKISAEYRKIISLSAKKKWKEFKKTESYQIWRKRKSEFMTERMKNGFASELACRRYEQNPNAKEEISKHFKELWKNEEYRNRTIASIRKAKSTPEAKEKMKQSMSLMWKEKTEEERKAFNDKMKIVNSNEEKREDASKKIKKKWQDPVFKEKMSKRKHGSNSSTMKERWKDPEFRKMMLEARKKK